MAEKDLVTELKQTAVVDEPKKIRNYGGRTDARDLDNEDKAIFEEHRDVIESKLQSELQVAKDLKIKPVNVRTQVVAGTNYFFQVNLPSNESAEVKVFKPLVNHELNSLPKSERVTVKKNTHSN